MTCFGIRNDAVRNAIRARPSRQLGGLDQRAFAALKGMRTASVSNPKQFISIRGLTVCGSSTTAVYRGRDPAVNTIRSDLKDATGRVIAHPTVWAIRRKRRIYRRLFLGFWQWQFRTTTYDRRRSTSIVTSRP